MSVFLAPNLSPIIGGTYFPPEDRHGYPGFKNVLLGISKEVERERALTDVHSIESASTSI